jgi:hypothetical protein
LLRDSLYSSFRLGYSGGSVQHTEDDVVAPRLVMFEPDHLAAIPRRIVAEQVVRRGLDPHDISAKLEVLPLAKARQLNFLCLDLFRHTHVALDAVGESHQPRASRP